MDVANTPLAERIARVLAGQKLSANAQGTEESAGSHVDGIWRDHLADAVAVLHTLRVPDRAMAAAGDVAVWERMVLTALDESKPHGLAM